MEPLSLFRVLLIFLLASTSSLSHADNSFYIGVSPHTSARNLMSQFRPVRERFEQALKRPVKIVTALNFTQFIERALDGRYDLVMTTAHQALLLVEKRGYIPLFTYKAQFHGLAVTALRNKGRPLNELNQTTVIGLNPSSMVTLWGESWMQQQQITPKRINYITASDSAVRQLLQHHASLVFISLPDYASLPQKLRDQIIIVAKSQPMPGRVYALSPKWRAQADTVREVMERFIATKDGEHFLDAYHLQGLRRLEPNELEIVRPYMQRMMDHLEALTP